MMLADSESLSASDCVVCKTEFCESYTCSIVSGKSTQFQLLNADTVAP